MYSVRNTTLCPCAGHVCHAMSCSAKPDTSVSQNLSAALDDSSSSCVSCTWIVDVHQLKSTHAISLDFTSCTLLFTPGLWAMTVPAPSGGMLNRSQHAAREEWRDGLSRERIGGRARLLSMRTGRSRADGDVQINGATGESYRVALKRSRGQQDLRTAEAIGAQVQVGRRFGDDTRSYGEATVDTSLSCTILSAFVALASAHLVMYDAGGVDRRCRSCSFVGRLFNEDTTR